MPDNFAVHSAPYKSMLSKSMTAPPKKTAEDVKLLLNSADVESLDELGALETKIRTQGKLVKDFNATNESKQCFKQLINGSELAKWLVSSGHSADAAAACQLGQRLIDAQQLFAVDLGTNKTVRRGFSDAADAFFRFERDRYLGADVQPKYSLTKFYFAKIEALSINMYFVGQRKFCPFFAVLLRAEKVMYRFTNPESTKPFDEIPLARASYHVTNKIDIEADAKWQFNGEGAFLTLVTPQRILLLLLSSTIQRANWVEALEMLGVPRLQRKPEHISAVSVHTVFRDLLDEKADQVTSVAVVAAASPASKPAASPAASSSSAATAVRPSGNSPAKSGASSATPSPAASPVPSKRTVAAGGVSAAKLEQEKQAKAKADAEKERAERERRFSAVNKTAAAAAATSNAANSAPAKQSTPAANAATNAAAEKAKAEAEEKERARVKAEQAERERKAKEAEEKAAEAARQVEQQRAYLENERLAAEAASRQAEEEARAELARKEAERAAAAQAAAAAAAQAAATASAGAKEAPARPTHKPSLSVAVVSGQRAVPAASDPLASPRSPLSPASPVPSTPEVPGLMASTFTDFAPPAGGRNRSATTMPVQRQTSAVGADKKTSKDDSAAGKKAPPPLTRPKSLVGSALKTDAADDDSPTANTPASPRAASASQSGSSANASNQQLSLNDVLETPQYRIALLKFLEANHCAENLNFLESEQAYRRIGADDAMAERRAQAAQLIYTEFIAPDASQLVNIDAETSNEIVRKLEAKNYSPNLFHPAALVIFNMVDRDVYRRFIGSEGYKEMLVDPSANAASAIGAIRRRKHSFSVVPMEEKLTELDEIAEKFSKSGIVKDRRYHLKKYHLCFKGRKMVDWLIANNFAKNRPAGVAVGQRMYDANIIRHVVDEQEFTDSDQLYTLQNKLKLAQGPSPLELTTKYKVHAGYLLLKGVHYNRVFACLTLDQKHRLYLYRDHNSQLPIMKVKLKGAKFVIFSQDDGKSGAANNDEFDFGNTQASRLRSATLPTKSLIAPKAVAREPICYLQLDTPQRALDFRIESVKAHAEWAAALAKCGVQQMKKADWNASASAVGTAGGGGAAGKAAADDDDDD